jgi:hypothetical protein
VAHDPTLPRSPASHLETVRTRWIAAVLYIVLVGAFAAGVWASYRAMYPGQGLYRMTGVFQVRWDDRTILVNHEEVPGLMSEMGAMSLVVESKELLDEAGLRPGDRVRLIVRQLPDRLVVTEIRKLP